MFKQQGCRIVQTGRGNAALAVLSGLMLVAAFGFSPIVAPVLAAEHEKADEAEKAEGDAEKKEMHAEEGHADDHGEHSDHGHGHHEKIAGPFGIFLSEEDKTSRISDASAPEVTADPRMQRPPPLIEWGNPFLGSGNIGPGIEMPGGSVWQPSLWVYGQYRTAIQAFNNGDDTFSEWANSLDIFANLQLTGTERLVVGFNPLAEDGRFSGYEFSPDFDDGWEDATNLELTTLFFEGDLGEILADWDPQDSASLDWGFSVGRQPIVIQEGMLINDTIDSIGIIRNTLLPAGGTDLQVTFLYGWGDVDRNDNRRDSDSHLLGMFWAADYPFSTINADFVYVIDNENDEGSGGDGLYWGVSGVQRMGHYNTSLRVLGSHALEGESPEVSDGYLMFGEVSWTPAWTHDNIYVNGFFGVDEFSSAARGPTTGGPLGRTGILFAAVGLGRYGAALGNRAENSYGGAVGYQWFIDHQKRRQLIVELGGRNGYKNDGNDGQLALGARYQQAIGQRMVIQFDAFGALNENRDEGFGGRVELRVNF